MQRRVCSVGVHVKRFCSLYCTVVCLHWRFRASPRALLSRVSPLAAFSLSLRATPTEYPTRQEKQGKKERLGVFYVLSEMLCGFLDTEASTRPQTRRQSKASSHVFTSHLICSRRSLPRVLALHEAHRARALRVEHAQPLH